MALSPQNREQAAWYLAGIIDGEGYVCISGKTKRVEICNTDLSIIAACEDALDLLGICYRTRPMKQQPNRKLALKIIIGQHKDIVHLYELVNLQSSSKQGTLEKLAKLPYFRWDSNDPRISEVIKLYVEDLISTQAIARIFNVDDSTICSILERNNVRRRNRSEAARLRWIKEKQNA